MLISSTLVFFVSDTATTCIDTYRHPPPLPDSIPIYESLRSDAGQGTGQLERLGRGLGLGHNALTPVQGRHCHHGDAVLGGDRYGGKVHTDRKSKRLNSSN